MSRAEELSETEQRDLALHEAARRIDFRRVSNDCPWLRETKLQGLLWASLTGENGPAPDMDTLRCRLQVESPQGGWSLVEPRDGWTLDQLTKERLLARFGGGRFFKASIRYKGNDLPGSVVRFDLTGESEPAKPIPGDAAAPQVSAPRVAAAPTAAATAAQVDGHDPESMLLAALPDEHRAPVAFALACSRREEERQARFYGTMVDVLRTGIGARPESGSAELARRLEADLTTERAETARLRALVAQQQTELFDLRMRLALTQAGINAGMPSTAPSPLFDTLKELLLRAAPGFAEGLGKRIDPAQVLQLANNALSRLPPEQAAVVMQNALASGGVPS